MKKLITLILCAALMLSLPSVWAAAAAELTPGEVMDGILDNALAKSGARDLQQWVDTSLAQGAGTGSEWYVIALVERGEELDYSRFAAALQAYVDSREVSNAADRERIAVAFLAMGYVSPYTEYAANCSIGKLGIMSYVFGLHLSNNGVKCSMTSQEIIDVILERRLEDGGWAISGKWGDPDTTAMVLQALAPHRQDSAVAEAVEGGLAFLSENQLDNGGFRSFGQECPESICQVLVTLCTLSIDPLDEAFQKNGRTLFDALYAFRLEDGSFRHTMDTDSNNLATVETLYALAAYESYLRGGKTLYEFPAPTVDISVAQEKAAEPLPTPEPTEEPPAQSAGEEASPLSGKRLWLCIGVGVLALAACAYFFFSGRRNPKNFLFVLLAAAGLIYMIFAIRIEKTEDYYTATTATGETVTASISIRCDVIKGEAPHVPDDGVVLEEVEITLPEGSTSYDLLVEACKANKLHLDKEASAFGSAYVKGMANIYEFDFGELSGWMYCVNDHYSDIGAGEYKLKDGDHIQWHYTKELGRDLGSEFFH